jgi:predicted transcriptional regulator
MFGMKSNLTIRLDENFALLLARLSKRMRRTRSDLARDALRRRLALLQLADLRRKVLPFAEARGYLTDEDVIRDVS